MKRTKGGFTMPGESGYEKLTLELAEKWGADVIRDSDGTKLSDEILNAGYDIYSTICIIREHNEWAKEHPEALQQTFLSTQPRCAVGEEFTISVMEDFYEEQFKVNDTEKAMKYWQVWDRTSNCLLQDSDWSWCKEDRTVNIVNTVPFHEYTVSFLAYRIWEEISMYNHVTNNWEKEHLMPIDPRTDAAKEYLSNWLVKWCEEHPNTNVVRFTSMFYNFVWIWGSDEKCRNLFTDWGSYDFTVSEKALEDFEKAYGYASTAEDFINKGNFQVTHMPPTAAKKDYMEFTQAFVASYGKELVNIVHKYGKKAYVFYDDSWVGVEPYGKHFKEYGFDGMIKCVFSGYEARMCAGVDVETHELRLHPYLFPVGLGGAPTFMEGGNPTLDAKVYWKNVRRALLRQKIDRIGLGGYIHLVEDFPDFTQYIAEVSEEFRTIRDLHEAGGVYTLPLKVGVLHTWGALRPWTLSGHFHETYMHVLIHINEALAGLPVDVEFLSFEDAKNGKLEDVDVVINAGRAGTAWSGGDVWEDERLLEAVRKWVYEGGVFIGVDEPTAVAGYGDYFRLARILGVDKDTGARVCHGRWPVHENPVAGLIPEGEVLETKENLYLTDGNVRVLAESEGKISIAANDFGKGKGIYMAGFSFSPVNARMLLNLMLWAKGESLENNYLPDNSYVECAWFPHNRKLILINNSDEVQKASVKTEDGVVTAELDPYETKILER